MPNTVTQKTLEGSGSDTLVSRIIHINSDGSEETDLIIFDNSAFCNNTAKGRVLMIEAWGASCELIFEWDQGTDSEICRLNPADHAYIDFCCLGGGGNPNGSGATGDLLLTTANLDSGDIVTIKLLISQS